MSSTFPSSEDPIHAEVAHQLSQQKVAQQLSKVSGRHAELETAKWMEQKTSDIKATTKELQNMDAGKMPEDMTQKDERDNEEDHPVEETTPATDLDPAHAGMEETPRIPSKRQASVLESTAVRTKTSPIPSKRPRR